MKYILIILFPQILWAQIILAFVEMRDAHNKVVQLEPGGRFAQVAVSYGPDWLHAHAFRGVELITTAELQKMGQVTQVVWHPSNKLTFQQVQSFLGKPFDHEYSWEDGHYYCSELVGKILGIKPKPMKFDLWPDYYKKKRGQLGLSPDDIYRLTTRR